MDNTETANIRLLQNVKEITDFDASELDVYARLTEAQLLNKNHPEKGLFIAESPKVIIRALDGGYEPVSVLVEKKQALEDAETIAVLERCANVSSPFHVVALGTAYEESVFQGGDVALDCFGRKLGALRAFERCGQL